MFLPSNITLQFGDSGDFVSELQRRMCLVQCFNETMVNGFYDGNTANGVSRFQGMVGLHVDGVAGPETLRRLNGVISGGGSIPDDKKEEEQKIIAAAPAVGLGDMFIGGGVPDIASVFGTAPAQPEVPPPQAELQAQADLPPMQPLHSQQQVQETVLAAQQQQQQSQVLQQQTLADMLLGQNAQQQNPLQQPQQMPDQQQAAHAAHQHDAAAAALQQQQAQQTTPTQQTPEAKPAVAAAEAPAKQGIIGRTLQFANSMMQKLADYFEAKLPPATLQEVREIGNVMLASGMKEAAIPAGPDMIRTPQTPAISTGQTPPAQQQRT